jgi:hypothetical protein
VFLHGLVPVVASFLINLLFLLFLVVVGLFDYRAFEIILHLVHDPAFVVFEEFGVHRLN